ncbi:UNVERIFIED_CONTAM: hypothetical protein Slati_3830800 [Sesamum latifolium]|uniref:Retrotransposon gag domain-containing protein n=1 Tax=Sesamum latifolium TaxID=2727402 RepID=A0AAW2TL63_9LAMI
MGGTPTNTRNEFAIQAMQQQFARIGAILEGITDRLEMMEQPTLKRRNIHQIRKLDSEEEEEVEPPHCGNRGGRRRQGNEIDRDLEKKVKLAAVEFTDYAIVWWDQLITNRRRYRERPISTWAEMKSIMRKRFVHSHYFRDLYQKLQTMTQDVKSVDEYYKEMEIAMIKANVEEDREATMARFLSGLNQEIANIVELQYYVEVEDMVHTRQLKRKGSNQINYTSIFSHQTSREKGLQRQILGSPPKTQNEASKAKSNKVLAILHRNALTRECDDLKENSDIESESEHEPNDDEQVEETTPEHGELLVVRRALNMHMKVDNAEQQRENIFHTRCLVQGNVCMLIIDGGSCANVDSCEMVEKLNLATTKHPNPYKLQWLNDYGEVR